MATYNNTTTATTSNQKATNTSYQNAKGTTGKASQQQSVTQAKMDRYYQKTGYNTPAEQEAAEASIAAAARAAANSTNINPLTTNVQPDRNKGYTAPTATTAATTGAQSTYTAPTGTVGAPSITQSPLPETPSYQSDVRVTPKQQSQELMAEMKKAVLAPSRKKPVGRDKVRKELARDRLATQQILADELNKQIDMTLDVQPRNNDNPVVRSNQYTKGLEFISAIGKDYVGFYHKLADDTTLIGRGRIGDIPRVKPELLLYNRSEVLPELVQDTIDKEAEANRNPDFGLIIPAGHPLGVGATHESGGSQYYNCPPDVPITHPIVERCSKIDKLITNGLLK